jgi:hypothetical protein
VRGCLRPATCIPAPAAAAAAPAEIHALLPSAAAPARSPPSAAAADAGSAPPPRAARAAARAAEPRPGRAAHAPPSAPPPPPPPPANAVRPPRARAAAPAAPPRKCVSTVKDRWDASQPASQPASQDGTHRRRHPPSAPSLHRLQLRRRGRAPRPDPAHGTPPQPRARGRPIDTARRTGKARPKALRAHLRRILELGSALASRPRCAAWILTAAPCRRPSCRRAAHARRATTGRPNDEYTDSAQPHVVSAMDGEMTGVSLLISDASDRMGHSSVSDSLGRVRVRVETMVSQKCRIVGKSQSVLAMMANPMIFTRTRTTLAVPSSPDLPRWHLCSRVAAA